MARPQASELFVRCLEREGVRRWFLANRARDRLSVYELEQTRESDFIALVMRTRARLEELYAGDVAAELKRAEKARIFAELRSATGLRRKSSHVASQSVPP